MRGSGGGGGAALGYLIAQNPEAAVALGAIFLAAAGVYGTAVLIDQPHRPEHVETLTSRSAENCLNFRADANAYAELKENLLKVWSNTLEDISGQSNLTICTDSNLGNIYMPYQTDKGGDGYMHMGEYRVAAVVYTNAEGHRTVVTKPESFRKAPQSRDIEADPSEGTGSVLKEALFRAQGAPQIDLGNGVKAQILLQRDGVYQRSEYGSTYDEQGLMWASPQLQQQVSAQYSLSWPARTGGTSPSW